MGRWDWYDTARTSSRLRGRKRPPTASCSDRSVNSGVWMSCCSRYARMTSGLSKYRSYADVLMSSCEPSGPPAAAAATSPLARTCAELVVSSNRACAGIKGSFSPVEAERRDQKKKGMLLGRDRERETERMEEEGGLRACTRHGRWGEGGREGRGTHGVDGASRGCACRHR